MDPKYQKMRDKKETPLQRLENMHPHLLITYLTVLGSGIIFCFLVLAFVNASKGEQDYYALPKFFAVSTVAILLSSFLLHRARLLFSSGQNALVRKNLSIALAMGLVFCISQLLGWAEMQRSGAFFAGTGNTNSYFYLLSALHLLHMGAGVAFMLVVYRKNFLAKFDPVRALLLETSPYEKVRLKMLNVYWHAMDAIWLMIFFVLLFFQ